MGIEFNHTTYIKKLTLCLTCDRFPIELVYSFQKSLKIFFKKYRKSTCQKFMRLLTYLYSWWKKKVLKIRSVRFITGNWLMFSRTIKILIYEIILSPGQKLFAYQTKIYANLPILTQVEIYLPRDWILISSKYKVKQKLLFPRKLIRACWHCNCPRKVGQLGTEKLEECQVISASYLGF